MDRKRLTLIAATLFTIAATLLFLRHRHDDLRTTAASQAAAAAGEPSAETLRAALQDAALPIQKLEVRQLDGIFLIRGKTSDRTCPARAAEIAHSLGITRVANLVRIDLRSSDEEITRIAERRLSASPDLEGCRFGVRSKEGVLQIHGTIYSDLQRETATRTVKDIEGVVDVQTNLTKL